MWALGGAGLYNVLHDQIYSAHIHNWNATSRRDSARTLESLRPGLRVRHGDVVDANKGSDVLVLVLRRVFWYF